MYVQWCYRRGYSKYCPPRTHPSRILGKGSSRWCNPDDVMRCHYNSMSSDQIMSMCHNSCAIPTDIKAPNFQHFITFLCSLWFLILVYGVLWWKRCKCRSLQYLSHSLLLSPQRRICHAKGSALQDSRTAHINPRQTWTLKGKSFSTAHHTNAFIQHSALSHIWLTGFICTWKCCCRFTLWGCSCSLQRSMKTSVLLRTKSTFPISSALSIRWGEISAQNYPQLSCLLTISLTSLIYI